MLKGFVASLPAHVICVVDEAYVEYVDEPDYPDASRWLDDLPNLIVTRTFSKAYGLAALRVGYGLMAVEVAGVLNRVRQPFNVSLPAQAAAAAAIEDAEFLRDTLRVVHQGVDYLHAALTEMGLDCRPTQSNFLMFRVPVDARRVFEGLLDYDNQKHEVMPGLASRWEMSADGRSWTFYPAP